MAFETTGSVRTADGAGLLGYYVLQFVRLETTFPPETTHNFNKWFSVEYVCVVGNACNNESELDIEWGFACCCSMRSECH